jgi:hypothetical protein
MAVPLQVRMLHSESTAVIKTKALWKVGVMGTPAAVTLTTAEAACPFTKHRQQCRQDHV